MIGAIKERISRVRREKKLLRPMTAFRVGLVKSQLLAVQAAIVQESNDNAAIEENQKGRQTPATKGASEIWNFTSESYA